MLHYIAGFSIEDPCGGNRSSRSIAGVYTTSQDQSTAGVHAPILRWAASRRDLSTERLPTTTTLRLHVHWSVTPLITSSFGISQVLLRLQYWEIDHSLGTCTQECGSQGVCNSLFRNVLTNLLTHLISLSLSVLTRASIRAEFSAVTTTSSCSNGDSPTWVKPLRRPWPWSRRSCVIDCFCHSTCQSQTLGYLLRYACFSSHRVHLEDVLSYIGHGRTCIHFPIVILAAKSSIISYFISAGAFHQLIHWYGINFLRPCPRTHNSSNDAFDTTRSLTRRFHYMAIVLVMKSELYSPYNDMVAFNDCSVVSCRERQLSSSPLPPEHI